MTLRKKILLLMYALTFLIILSMSSIYYAVFKSQIKERSQNEIIQTYSLILDDFRTRAQTLNTKFEQFLQSSVSSPLYLVQLLEAQYSQIDRDWSVREARKIIPQISTIVNELREFHQLVDATEILIYNNKKQLSAFYSDTDEQTIAGAYLPKLSEDALIPVSVKDDWFLRLKDVNNIPLIPLTSDLQTIYPAEFPDKSIITLHPKGATLILSLTLPILRRGQTEGLGIMNIALRREDVERYSRLSQTKVNLFAGQTLSVGTLEDYRSLPQMHENSHRVADILQKRETPAVQFSEISFQEQQYYQGALFIGTDDNLLGAIIVHFPRSLEEEGRRKLFKLVIGITLFFIIVGGAGAFLLSDIIVRPIRIVTHLLQLLTKGEIADIAVPAISSRSKNELEHLTMSFYSMVHYFREMASVAEHISKGEISQEITLRSEQDVLGTAFHEMTDYLKEIGLVATHVAQGDLRSEILLRSNNDQFGEAFKRMQHGLINLVGQIRTGEQQLASISQHVLEASNKSSETLEQVGSTAEVTTSAMQEVNSSAEEVRMNTGHLASAVEETSSSISQMISSIKHVADNSRKLSHFADDTKKTVINIVNSLETVAEQAEYSKKFAETTTQDAVSGQDSVSQMIHRMNTISDVTENLSTIILRLESRSKEIGTILDVINDVAEQTSMLALNASIIAAQAGTHGRAFAVVADENKDLATRVHNSTKEIAKIVKAVQQDSSNAVTTIALGQEEVKHGVSDAQSAGEALNQIRQSAEESSKVTAKMAVSVLEQTTAHTHIVESIRDVADMINEITRATQEQEKNSSQLFVVVENMQELAAQVSYATEEQQKSTHHVTDFMEDVKLLVEENIIITTQLTQASKDLSSQAKLLKKQVKQFALPEERNTEKNE